MFGGRQRISRAGGNKGRARLPPSILRSCVVSEVQLAIVSDIHYAGLAERARVGYPLAHISHPLQRLAIAAYRRYFWQRDPFAHNHLLDQFIDRCRDSDLVVANGDCSCDSAAIGVSDDPACQSAGECLEKLRTAFPGRLEATI